jgi:catechol 2,3-dioxygenase-like lactoylglutathione lyase family enzyme
MPVAAVPDHVAVAVPDIEAAAAWWRQELGAGWANHGMFRPDAPFHVRQLRFANGARLELLQPNGDGFARAFLDRFGPRVHHVTFKVPDALMPAVETVRKAGYDVIDVNTEGGWHEGFLRPSQVGGVIAQIAWSDSTPDDHARRNADVAEEPRGEAALLGPTLTHPDLDAAEHVWTTLGGKVTHERDALMVAWDGAPLTVRVERGETAGPVGLRLAGTPARPADPVTGAAILPAD